MLVVSNLYFSYRNSSDGTVSTLRNVNLLVKRGEFVCVQGRSGSGKSTLFYMLGCLLRPDRGRIFIDGVDLTSLDEEALAFFRNQKIGFVFQQFHLLARASVLDNILLPTFYPCEKSREPTAREIAKARELAEQLGIGSRIHHVPNQLSGGEQQRVAIARALMTDADLILADEPTGNLDSVNAARTLEVFKQLNRQGKTIILITHDNEVARQCPRVCHLKDGSFVDAPDEVALPTPARKFEVREAIPRLGRYWRLARAVAPVAAENLRRNKIRALLTMIGVTVGIASVFAMVTFGQFAKKKILEGYEDLGVNSVIIRGYPNWRLRAMDRVSLMFHGFDWEKDILHMRRIYPSMQLVSPMLGSWDNTINYGGVSIENEVKVLGVNADYLRIMNRKLTSGRLITPFQVDQASQVCLIGSDIAKRLFRDVSPLGEILFISKGDQEAYPCEVIGVLEALHSNKEWQKPNLDVLMPYTYFTACTNRWEAQIHQYAAQFVPGTDLENASRGIKAYYRQKYGRSGEFGVDSDTLLVAQMRKFLALFAILLTAIALITLGVGGMGINNMMLVSLAERFKEIGLRKAVGATNLSVRVQFLLESVFLAAIAGVLGLFLGFSTYELIIYLASKFIAKLTFEWAIDPVALFVSLVSMLLVGVASGIVPAVRAERLEVIEALRSE